MVGIPPGGVRASNDGTTERSWTASGSERDRVHAPHPANRALTGPARAWHGAQVSRAAVTTPAEAGAGQPHDAHRHRPAPTSTSRRTNLAAARIRYPDPAARRAGASGRTPAAFPLSRRGRQRRSGPVRDRLSRVSGAGSGNHRGPGAAAPLPLVLRRSIMCPRPRPRPSSGETISANPEKTKGRRYSSSLAALLRRLLAWVPGAAEPGSALAAARTSPATTASLH